MSLFAGYARQAAALPRQPAPPPPPPPPMSSGRGLFGSRRRPGEFGVLQTLLMGTNARDAAEERAARMAEQERQAQLAEEQRIIGDRLRAQLSPADGPNGSGTGAAPTIEQQMAALDEARLLNPAVAEQFAPIVQQRRMAELTRGRPIEEQLAVELNPERAGQSYASQFEDIPLAGGTIRSRGSQTVNAAPRVEQFDDRFGIYDPRTGETNYTPARSPTYQEETTRNLGQGNLDVARGRLELDRDNSGFTLGQGQARYDRYGNPVAERSPAPGNANGNLTETQAKDGFNVSRMVSAGSIIRQFEENGFDFGREALTGGQLRGDYRSYEAAAYEWTDALLRLTSGAQAPEGEIRSAMRAYFAQPGDDENVRRQKAEMRAQAESSGIVRAGPGYSAPSPQQSQGSGPVAVNPQTGERVQWNGQAWVPVR